MLIVLLTGCGDSAKGNKSVDQATNQNQIQSNTEEKIHFYYTANESGSVSKIDAATNEVVDTITEADGAPHGCRISKDSKFAYVANMGEDTISVVDIENNKEVRKITVGKTPVTTGITSDGKTLAATVNSENVLAIIDLSTDKVEKVAVGKGPAQVYIEPDYKYAFVANQGTKDAPSNTVLKIDMSTKKVVATYRNRKRSSRNSS